MSNTSAKNGTVMNKQETKVASLIREAFRGVKLGDGVGLMQAQGLDDYADAETLTRYRAGDQKEDWSRISVSDLNRCASSLSFFDAEGMRFHLPAYLIADLEGTLEQDVVFHLTCFDQRELSWLMALSDAVREYLLLQLRRSDDFIRPRIEKALAEYWPP
jgi:hypothetical protein